MSTRSFLQGLGYPVEKPKLADEALYGVVWLAGIAQREVTKVLRTYRLTPVKFNYLMVVKHIGGAEGLSQREIARRLLIDAGNVAHVLDDLERRGWAVREAGPDKRSNRIRITVKGDNLLDEAWPAYKAVIRRLTGGLQETAHKRLVDALNEWRDTLKTCDG